MTAAALSANVAALFAARVFCFDVDVTADPDGGPPILGHPADVGRAQSTAALPRLADLLHSPLLRGDGPPVLFLVEPKAGPEKRPELVKRILEIAETASALSQRARAIYLISSNAADAASDAAAGARVAFPLLDRTKCPVPPEALRAASLLMPSVRCMEGASRQAVDRWRGTHAGAEIVSWLADDCRSLRAALADGATRVVSNVADDLARNCTF
ncbi:hypothetical protein DFJ74DRAFT_712695 [Hyaloraphidium curvatum]|nr:hypothetical protein DFJ74DRAFT_712695 [Hyaloraphidium curvatum]